MGTIIINTSQDRLYPVLGHGTALRYSVAVGRAASSGGIGMLNADATDLFERVHIGAPVHVLR